MIIKYPILNNNKEFLKWRFCESSVYEYQGYIEINPNLVKNFINKKRYCVIYIDGKPHVKICFFYNKESNIKLYKLILGDLYCKISLTKPEINLDYLEDLKDFKKEKFQKIIFEEKIKTNDNWYENYKISNEDYVECTIILTEYNFKIWTIILAGNDDYSLSKEFINEEDM